MQKHTLLDLQPIFADYLDKPGFARYTIEKIATKKKGKDLVTAFKISNKGDKDIIIAILKKPAGNKSTERLHLKKSENRILTITSGTEAETDDVSIDPKGVFPVCLLGIKGPGGIVYSDKNRDIRFLDIVNDTPLAKAGIKDNMKLISINGEAPDSEDICRLNLALLRPQGTTLKLTVSEDDGEPREVTVQY
jgi:predicted metalloprotease with PDZ domain